MRKALRVLFYMPVSYYNLKDRGEDVRKHKIRGELMYNIIDTEILSGTSLVGTIDGNLLPVPAFSNIPGELTNIINKNTKELYALYVNLKTINTAVKENITVLQSKQTEIINKLKETGIIKDESTN